MFIILERKTPHTEAFHTRIKTIPAEITKDNAKASQKIIRLFFNIVNKAIEFIEFPVWNVANPVIPLIISFCGEKKLSGKKKPAKIKTIITPKKKDK